MLLRNVVSFIVVKKSIISANSKAKIKMKKLFDLIVSFSLIVIIVQQRYVAKF